MIQAGEIPLDAGNGVLRFAALQCGPLGKIAATEALYLRAIGYARKLQVGYNPIGQMPRVKLLLRGAQRKNGPPVRKLPASREDLVKMRNSLSITDVNTNILFCTIAIGWFFTLRKSEYLGSGVEGRSANTFRHTIRVEDIEPMYIGEMASWEGEVDSAPLHLEGCKTDWLNRGAARSHGMLDDAGIMLGFILCATSRSSLGQPLPGPAKTHICLLPAGETTA